MDRNPSAAETSEEPGTETNEEQQIASGDKSLLLTDLEMAGFIVNGYHLLELDLPEGLNERIAGQLNELDYNPGDAIAEVVPELWQVIEHPAVKGALVSLLGDDFEVMGHRHWHCKQPHTGHMSWHQDSTNNRDTRIDRLLGLFYPTDITPEMGPTVIVPGTQFRNAPTDRMSTYTNIHGQVPMVVKAGTFALTHYDLWHGTAANRTPVKRHMIKFLFRRVRDNKAPTWNHDPDVMNVPTAWGGKREDPKNVLSFGNPIGVGQSDHYKERQIRWKCWNNLLGADDAPDA